VPLPVNRQCRQRTIAPFRTQSEQNLPCIAPQPVSLDQAILNIPAEVGLLNLC
jgi:hypothetical protein